MPASAYPIVGLFLGVSILSGLAAARAVGMSRTREAIYLPEPRSASSISSATAWA